MKNSTSCLFSCFIGIISGSGLIFFYNDFWVHVLGCSNFFGAGGMVMAAAVWYKEGQ